MRARMPVRRLGVPEEMEAIRSGSKPPRPLRWIPVILVAPLITLAGASMLRRPPEPPPPPLLAAPQFDPSLVRAPSLDLQADAAIPFERTLGRGESLAGLLAEMGLPPRDRQQVSTA